MIIRKNGYAVLGLEHERKTRVVHQYTILKTTVNTSKILSVVSFLECAMLPIKPMRKIFLLRVEVVKHNISVGGTASSEDNNFSEVGKFFQELNAMRSHSDPCLYNRMVTEMVVPP